MSLGDFKRLLSSVPKAVNVSFAGVTEPFDNPALADMILHADETGHSVAVFTTMCGVSPEQITSICHVDFSVFMVHMPDTKHLTFKFEDNWAKSLHAACSLIPSMKFMSMDDWFTAFNGREHLSRGIRGKYKPFGFCWKLSNPQMMVYPNGDMYLCCVDFALEHRIGNLLQESYADIRARMLQNTPYSLCHYCNYYLSFPRWTVRETAKMFRCKILKHKEGGM